MARYLLASLVWLGVAHGLALTAEPTRVELATDQQRMVFTLADGTFALTTDVRDGGAWRPLFDAAQPVLDGPLFGLRPSSYAVVSDDAERKAVEFAGHHRQPDYDWSLRVEASTGSPLIHVVVTCHLLAPLTLDAPQPTVALWMRGRPAFHLDQGPDSIYGSAGIPFGFGFPAAYLWDAGREAAVFFGMTRAAWMQPDGVARFHDARVMTRDEPDRAGLGLHVRRLTGSRVPAGDMVVEFYLHQAARATRPTGLEALDTMVRAFAPLHPAAAGWPLDRFTGQPASWDHFAQQALTDLRQPTTMAEIAAPWHDEPLALVPPRETMVVHPATPMADAAGVAGSWDYSTVNNHLTPWLLLSRLRGDAEALRLGLAKLRALPRFYDPRAGILRHGTRQPPHVGDLEMCWQNLVFHQEALRASSAVSDADFDPAVPGRVLMATAGLRALAHQTSYVLPQWFNPYARQPAVQNDVKQLGVIREPWQLGAYARLMTQAHALTGAAEFLAEARTALDMLFERLSFGVKNEVYDRQYRDPAEFPVTELFGNAEGIAAARALWEVTGEARYRRYARDFLNTLLRLTFWYEDETDPVSRELRNAGLFYPHGGAHVATPWETVEAHLAIAATLAHDPDHPLTDLLLRLSDLNRVNAFGFFPATWSDRVRALDPTPRPALGSYFPIEPFYCLEGTGGHRGPTAAYMASLALWNDWLYQALAEADDRAVMVLNLNALDGYDAALAGDVRQVLVYNPGPAERACRVRFRHLAAGSYTLRSGARPEQRTAAELAAGVPVALPAGGQVRLSARRIGIQNPPRAARDLLACAYWRLQTRAAATEAEMRGFAAALDALHAGRADEAARLAASLCRRLENRP